MSNYRQVLAVLAILVHGINGETAAYATCCLLVASHYAFEFEPVVRLLDVLRHCLPAKLLDARVVDVGDGFPYRVYRCDGLHKCINCGGHDEEEDEASSHG